MNTIDIANQYRGWVEGTKLNDEIKKYTHISINTLVTPWCAAFTSMILAKAGISHTKSLAARSYLTWGTAVTSPLPGDVVVFKRGSSVWQGHVGFYASEDKDNIYVLGGNQDNKVKIKAYPKSKLLGIRRA
jgi:uncharacterized protein (TIGR02594 family)